MVQVIVGTGQPTLWTWLGPLLLFGGSLLASGVAFLGIRTSNATNRKAITAADNRARADRIEARDRDFRTWQRDTLLRISSEAIEAALNCEDDYRRIGFMPSPMQLDSADPIEQAGRRIGVCGLQLRLVGAHEAADRCRDLRSVSNSRALLGAMLEFHRPYLQSLDPQRADDMELHATVTEKRMEFEGLLGYLNKVRGDFGETVERELRTLALPDTPESAREVERVSGSEV